MRRAPVFFVMLLCSAFLAVEAAAFEIAGLKSGMSMSEAKKVVQDLGYKKITVTENGIDAVSDPQSPLDGVFASFCKGKLVRAQRLLDPKFDHFVRLVEEKERELGKHRVAWARTEGLESGTEESIVFFSWTKGETSVTVSYRELSSNNQLDVVYEIKNSCW